MTVYSATDLAGSFADPDAGIFYLTATNVGRGTITITMATERTQQNVAADGSVMVSSIAGNNGTVTIEAQQTSDLHAFLVTWSNIKFTNQTLGNNTNFAAAAMSFRSISSGLLHTITGISPMKIPDIPYGAQGQMITWTLPAANIVTE